MIQKENIYVDRSRNNASFAIFFNKYYILIGFILPAYICVCTVMLYYHIAYDFWPENVLNRMKGPSTVTASEHYLQAPCRYGASEYVPLG